MWIDAHQHCWRIGQRGCSWPTIELKPIYRDFMPDELHALAAPLGIGGSVLVQSQPNDADTDFLCGLGAADDFVQGIVVWADLLAPDAADRLSKLAERAKVRGVRPMLQDLPPDWIANPALAPAFEAMADLDLSFDLLIRPAHLPYAAEVAAHWPDVNFIVNHAAKPNIAGRMLSPWREDLARVAANDNVFCKFSGLLTEAASGDGDTELAPYAQHVLDAFGRERVMWGSDWPVLNLAGMYRDWLEQAARLAYARTPQQCDLLFGGVARRVYRIEE